MEVGERERERERENCFGGEMNPTSFQSKNNNNNNNKNRFTR
jgi:hypothetical protein